MKANAFLIAVFLNVLFGSSEVRAFEYFDAEINYWNEVEKKEVKISEEERNYSENKSKSFDWKAQLDPRNDKFFEEGDYTPPKAFMELVRNPSDENIKNWFALMELKNKLSTRLHTRVAEYLRTNTQKLPPESQNALHQKANSIQVSTQDYRRYRFRLYFDSNCTHCQKMLESMKELQDRGFYVELKQLDNKALDLPFAVSKVAPGELQEKDIQSVPVLFVGDLNSKVVYRISGYQSADAILNQLQTPNPKESFK